MGSNIFKAPLKHFFQKMSFEVAQEFHLEVQKIDEDGSMENLLE